MEIRTSSQQLPTHGPQPEPSDCGDVAVFHDYFAIRGGGERLVLDMVKELCTTLTFGYRTAETYPEEAFPADFTDLNLPKWCRRPGLRPLALAVAFRLRRRMAARHRIRVFSGIAAPFAAPPKSSGGRNVFYCHTPPRFLFDQRLHFLSRLPPLMRPPARLVFGIFANRYRRAVARMHVILTNSENTRARIHRYLGRDSIVVYPPIDTKRFIFKGQGDYYLSMARLTALKRVDRIVDAFCAMPDKKLIIASGGEELDALRKRANGADNISFLSWSADDELARLVGNALATIYVPIDEDFGMSPVESMAAGKPVIGVAEGGLVESIVPGETGVLLKPEFTPEDLANAVRAMTPDRAAKMRPACEARAAFFARDRFISRLKAILSETAEEPAENG